MSLIKHEEAGVKENFGASTGLKSTDAVIKGVRMETECGRLPYVIPETEYLVVA